MNKQELKEQILRLSFGGVMYDISEGSELRELLSNNQKIADELADSINEYANGIDKGIKNFINDYRGK